MGTPRDTLSLTPATRDTCSQEVLQEHVSLMDHGQEAQLFAKVSVLMDLHRQILHNTIHEVIGKT